MPKRQFSNFWEAHIENLPAEHEPLLTAMLFKQGCSGTTQKLDFTQSNLVYDAVIEEKPFIHVISYFEINKKEAVAPLLQEWIWKNSPDTQVQWVMQKERDYLEEWKKYFKPFKLAGLHFVPIWLFNSKKYNLSSSVILEPGMAFGTGHHATTRFAISALKQLGSKLKSKAVIDVGAGSGILSVVAERFGAKSVLAVDNDPECWREAKKTFRLNKVRRAKSTSKQLQEIKKQYDVTIANIIDGVLMGLKEDLWRVTKPKGHLVLSGILTSGARAFITDFSSGRDYKILKEFHDEEWTSFLIQKL